MLQEFFRSTPESNPSRYNRARRRDSTLRKTPRDPRKQPVEPGVPADQAIIEDSPGGGHRVSFKTYHTRS